MNKKIKSPFRTHGILDPTEILSLIEPDMWGQLNRGPYQTQVDTIRLITGRREDKIEDSPLRYLPAYDWFSKQIEKFQCFIPHRGTIYNLSITRLLPGKMIPLHVDNQNIDSRKYHNTHRVHWILKTHPDVVFRVGDKIVPVQDGLIFEMNNLIPHYVVNKTNMERIHLMSDISLGEWCPRQDLNLQPRT